jgi:hypothetical protein
MGLSLVNMFCLLSSVRITYSMLLKILPFALHTSPLTVQALQSLALRPVQYSSLQCSKFLLTQSFLVSGLVGAHDPIFVLSRLLRGLKWGLLFEERRGLTTVGHSPSTGKWLCLCSLSLTHSLTPVWLFVDFGSPDVVSSRIQQRTPLPTFPYSRVRKSHRGLVSLTGRCVATDFS